MLYQLSYVRAGSILAAFCIRASLPIQRFMLIDLSSARRAARKYWPSFASSF